MMDDHYHSSVQAIDSAIEAYHDDPPPRPKHAKTRYLIQHSAKSQLFAPLKPCLWRQGWRDPGYHKADGANAWRVARRVGYVPERNPWSKLPNGGRLRQKVLSALSISTETSRDYTVFRYLDGGALKHALKDYLDAEQRLRELIGRPCERTEILSRIAEFLYARLFGVVLEPNPNQKGFDAFTKPKQQGERVQIKLARKAATNPSGIQLKKARLETRPFDRLAVLWMNPDSRVVDFVEVTIDQLLDIAKQREKTKSFEFFPKLVDEKTLRESRRRIRDRADKAGLADLLEIPDDLS